MTRSLIIDQTLESQTFAVPNSRLLLTGMATLLHLPMEIRLNIYERLFRPTYIALDVGNPALGCSYLIPKSARTKRWQPGQSSQLLSVCKMILHEARPVLYANTIFHVTTHTFAGCLPSSFSNGHPIAPYARHVVWQIDCDILKKYYVENSTFQQGDFAMLDTLEIVAKVDVWKGSFCGEDRDREGFVRGRNGMLEYGKLLLDHLRLDGRGSVQLVENQQYLGKGEVRLRLEKAGERLDSMETVVS